MIAAVSGRETFEHVVGRPRGHRGRGLRLSAKSMLCKIISIFLIEERLIPCPGERPMAGAERELPSDLNRTTRVRRRHRA